MNWKFMGIALIGLLVLSSFVMANGFGAHQSPPNQTQGMNQSPNTSGNMSNSGNLSEYDVNALIYTVQEEKMARDVYLYLYDKWGLDIFRNIAQSEQRHMEAVESLIEKYNVNYTVPSQEGVFTNPEIQELYKNLTEYGSKNITNALKVGIMIEKKDISDLSEIINTTNNSDIKNVLSHLLAGSENHLKAFTSMYDKYKEGNMTTNMQNNTNNSMRGHEHGHGKGAHEKSMNNNQTMKNNRGMNNGRFMYEHPIRISKMFESEWNQFREQFKEMFMQAFMFLRHFNLSII